MRLVHFLTKSKIINFSFLLQNDKKNPREKLKKKSLMFASLLRFFYVRTTSYFSKLWGEFSFMIFLNPRFLVLLL